MAKVICASCQELIELPDPPIARIINLEDVSMVVLQHGEHHKCPNCGLLLHYAITSLDGIDLVGSPMPGQDSKNLIVIPGQNPFRN
jgi:hypothetical protein